MNLRKKTSLLSWLVLAPAMPALAQVEKVAMRTTGISCGVCAMVSEVNFKRIPGVDKVTISLAKEAIMLTYKPGATFAPHGLREVLRPLEVGVVQFQISARGRVREQGGKRFLMAGKDRFVLAGSSTIPLDTPILIEAILNDRVDPMEVKILTFKLLNP